MAATEAEKAKFKKYYYNHQQKEIARVCKYNKEHYKRKQELDKIRRATRTPIKKLLFRSARYRATRLNLEFTITVEDILVPTHCPILGLELKVHMGYARPNSPSLDRINPTIGYTKDNIRVICYKANTMKSDASLHELELLVKYLRKQK